MAREYYIDGRIGVNGLKGHLGMGNPIKLSEAINRTLPNIPTLSANPYTFENGLNAVTTTGTVVKLGGDLTGNTVINGSNYSIDFQFEEIKTFLVDSSNATISANKNAKLNAISNITPAYCEVNVGTSTVNITSRDALNVTTTYQLPSNDAPSLGDMIVMDGTSKGRFVTYERDVIAEELINISVGDRSNIYLPFNEGSWQLKRVTFWAFGVTTGDNLKFNMVDALGNLLFNEQQITFTNRDPAGAGGAGIGFTEAVTFTHVGQPDNYFLNITDFNSIIPHTITRITLSFIKVF